eukprot:Hpha_TRINITY_DN15413_c0_g2::TRINITY_DN15413_c0_g2_i1::g.177110::m.177110
MMGYGMQSDSVGDGRMMPPTETGRPHVLGSDVKSGKYIGQVVTVIGEPEDFDEREKVAFVKMLDGTGVCVRLTPQASSSDLSTVMMFVGSLTQLDAGNSPAIASKNHCVGMIVSDHLPLPIPQSPGLNAYSRMIEVMRRHPECFGQQ